MKALAYDVETTTFEKGNPYSQKNKLVYVGVYDGEIPICSQIEYDESPYGNALNNIQKVINNHDLILGANLKFDLAWGRRYGLDFSEKRIWDVQLVHFMLQGQTCPYPSLDQIAEYYGLGSKLDVVKEEYWNKGLDTTDVPKDILEEYLTKDVELTYNVYFRQLEDVKAKGKAFERLVSLHNQDLAVLQEIEWNGMVFDEQESRELGEQCQERINEIDVQLMEFHGIAGFNPNSGDHVSCLLYGGAITIPRREVIGEFKTGERKGQPKERWVNHEYVLERLVSPLSRSELAKEGYYSTAEGTLRSLKGSKRAKQVIQHLLERAKLEKRVGTYYKGLPNLREKLDWEFGIIHGTLNQCVARTGRLSSSKPNMQNFDGEIKPLFGSRYA